ncbi:MAG TPA: class I SAM-dependent methyltransferase [Gammaproteobacteria bacterium]|nr:class I SAM-dependent methyltransferase [Gammaproteobacteria bacterium]
MVTERRWLVCAAALLIGISPARGQTRADCQRQYTPQRAQEGKDVIWEPIEDSMVGRMLEMAQVTAADKVYDLGAGDGRIVIAAAKQYGATGVGIEYDAGLVKHSRCLAAAEGVADRVTFIQGDIFERDFSDATVVTLYLTPNVLERLLPRLLALKPGTRVASYSFRIGDWEPEQQIDSLGDGSVFLWTVPTNAAGAWTFRKSNGTDAFEVELEQTFQKLAGLAGSSRVVGSLRGSELNFGFMQGTEKVRIEGVVESDRIVATVVRGETSAKYVATRNERAQRARGIGP